MYIKLSIGCITEKKILEDFHNLNYAIQDDSSMLAACGHSFNAAPSSDCNFSADFSIFVNELFDADTRN